MLIGSMFMVMTGPILLATGQAWPKCLAMTERK
jgi:hypothetical protein